MPKTVTPAEAAQTLRIGRNFLYDLLHSGKLRARKQGKEWRIPERAIQERLERLAANSK
jgi:excisionase family DNA binding protein